MNTSHFLYSSTHVLGENYLKLVRLQLWWAFSGYYSEADRFSECFRRHLLRGSSENISGNNIRVGFQVCIFVSWPCHLHRVLRCVSLSSDIGFLLWILRSIVFGGQSHSGVSLQGCLGDALWAISGADCTVLCCGLHDYRVVLELCVGGSHSVGCVGHSGQ